MEPNPNQCPDCGGPLQYEWEPPAYWIICRACDWKALTSRFPEIFSDNTEYMVQLRLGRGKAMDEVIALKRHTKMTTLQAKQSIDSKETIFLFKGHATKVVTLVDELEQRGLTPCIEPAFRWQLDDLHGIREV